jgi:6-methylsalicylic acid synthase
MDVGAPPDGEKVAVIGMSCRFPAAIGTPEACWDLLESGRITIGDPPPERCGAYLTRDADGPTILGKTCGRGSCLEHPGDFDAAFFGVPPREAEIMDPRQRIVLEIAWEALEHACIPPDSLAGTDTGVFIGVGSADYGRHLPEDLSRFQTWAGIGAVGCTVADGLSCLLDLRGPSYTIDAACASPLVPVHLACAGLRHREADLALAGGVNLIADPALTLALDAAQLLSSGGRSRPFDAAADGYVRAEGVGVLVLKRLADAERDQDRIFAVIAGSAVRHGGRANGIMAPGRQAQESVVRAASRQAGAAPESIGYVEAHGTATRAADSAEIAALSQLYGRHRPAGRPLLIGSVKGNIGHQEAAAGVAGIIKAVLALGQGRIPPQAGFAVPNPGIAWAGAGIEVAAAGCGWPAGSGPRRAGVSSFGYGGGVGHLILEQPPTPSRQVAVPAVPAAPRPRLFPVSGASEASVRASAAQLAALPPHPAGPSVTDIHHSLWHGRMRQRFRTAVVAADLESLQAGLRTIAGARRA